MAHSSRRFRGAVNQTPAASSADEDAANERRAGEFRPRKPGVETLPAGTILADRYEIEAKVGDGAHAVTYRARDARLGRVVAVKVLRPNLLADEQLVQRFTREAQYAAQVSHPNVVDVYDVATDADVSFIVLRYVPGTDLRRFLFDRDPIPADEAIAISSQILRGLSAIHAVGIVHRDVKPQNILISPDGQACVTDFGVAYAALSEGLTTHGTTVGTASYMAPEQARGGAVSPATDIYAVGVVLFEMLTGRLPFSAPNPMAVMLAHLQQAAPTPSEVAPALGISPRLDQIVLRAMAKESTDRFPDARAMTVALESDSIVDPSGSAFPNADDTQVVAPMAASAARHRAGEPRSSSDERTQHAGAAFAGATRVGPKIPPAGHAHAPASAPARSRRWGVPIALLLALTLGAVAVLAVAFAEGFGFGGADATPTNALIAVPGDADPTATLTPTAPPEEATTTAVSIVPVETPTATATETPTQTPTATPPATATATAIATATATNTPPPPTATATNTPQPPTPTVPPTDTPVPVQETPTPAIVSGVDPETVPLIAADQPGGMTLPASEWEGGYSDFNQSIYGRESIALYPQGTGYETATMRFRLSTTPTQSVQIEVYGMDDELSNRVTVSLSLNGEEFYRGDGPWENWNPDQANPTWTMLRMPVDAELLREGVNELTVVNLVPTGAVGAPPYLLLAEVDIVVGGAAFTTQRLRTNDVVAVNARPNGRDKPKKDNEKPNQKPDDKDKPDKPNRDRAGRD